MIALFDFDGTLTVKDTFIDFAVASVGRRRLLAAILSASPWLAMWKLHLCDAGTAKQHLFSALYKGLEYSVFQEWGRAYAPRVDTILRRDIMAKMERHIADGHRVYIISASIPEWIAPWAAAHGIDSDHVIGTEIETDAAGRLTGRFATPNCNGPEKVRRLLAVEPDLRNRSVYAYGNSTGDRAMLALGNYEF